MSSAAKSESSAHGDKANQSQKNSKSTAIGASADSNIRSIFAYGSWIWKPHFRYKDLAVSVALGFSRQLYQGSHQDYGTPSFPGRIATIVPNPDAAVLGCLYQLNRRHAADDLVEADKHQAARGFYRSQLVVENCSTGRTETCWVYIARKGDDNPYWLGRAEHREIAFQVSQARGSRGDNLDYVRRLVDFVRLQTRGVMDRDLDTKRVLRLATGEEASDQQRQPHHPPHQQPHHPPHQQQHRGHSEDQAKSTVFLVREEMLSQLAPREDVDGKRHRDHSTRPDHRDLQRLSLADKAKKEDKKMKKKKKKEEKKKRSH